MFWISIAWRLSTQRTNGFSLGEEPEESLRKLLNQYLCYKQENKDVSELIASSEVSYRILNSSDFCKNNAGFFECKYEVQEKTLVIMIGDISVCISFCGFKYPCSMSFYGLESFFSSAPDNNGLSGEQRVEVSSDNYKSAIECLLKYMATIVRRFLLKVADVMWCKKYSGYMPMRAKVEFINKIVNENVKIGDKYSNKRMKECFDSVLKKTYLLI